MKIDSHHHFWQYDPEEYDWITDALNILRRSFMPNLLKAEITAAGIQGTVAVQARQSLAENDWLLGLTEQHPWILGVVGWVPLIDPKVGDHLERYAAHPRFVGVRHVLQDEDDPRYMLRDDFNRGIAQLKEHNLVYDILIYEKHLPQTVEFVDRHPEQVFVLDHVAKPDIRAKSFDDWEHHIRELARRETVFCKLSGMATEANWNLWTEADLRPYVETVLDAFGPARLMYGSDWPVALLATPYERWHRVVKQFISNLSPRDQSRLMGETAREVYGLEVPDS